MTFAAGTSEVYSTGSSVPHRGRPMNRLTLRGNTYWDEMNGFIISAQTVKSVSGIPRIIASHQVLTPPRKWGYVPSVVSTTCRSEGPELSPSTGCCICTCPMSAIVSS